MNTYTFINQFGVEFTTKAKRYSTAYYEFKRSDEYINQDFTWLRNGVPQTF